MHKKHIAKISMRRKCNNSIVLFFPIIYLLGNSIILFVTKYKYREINIMTKMQTLVLSFLVSDQRI